MSRSELYFIEVSDNPQVTIFFTPLVHMPSHVHFILSSFNHSLLDTMHWLVSIDHYTKYYVHINPCSAWEITYHNHSIYCHAIRHCGMVNGLTYHTLHLLYWGSSNDPFWSFLSSPTLGGQSVGFLDPTLCPRRSLPKPL